MRSENQYPFGVIVHADSSDSTLMDIDIDTIRSLVRERRLACFRGFSGPQTSQEYEAWARMWGALLEWSFGTVFDVVAHDEPEDHAFDTGFMPMHWDGMYADYIPEFQIFQCLTAPAGVTGGRTLFTDTTLVLANAESDQRKVWESTTLRYHNPKLSHYGGHVISPLVEQHPITRQPIMRVLEPVPKDVDILNPPTVTIESTSAVDSDQLFSDLRASLYDPRHMYGHTWEEGDIVATDNYTLLHTREPFPRGTPRHLRRIHVLGSPPLPSRRVRASAHLP